MWDIIVIIKKSLLILSGGTSFVEQFTGCKYFKLLSNSKSFFFNKIILREAQ